MTSGGVFDVFVCVNTCAALKPHTAANVATGAPHLNNRPVNLVMSCSLPHHQILRSRFPLSRQGQMRYRSRVLEGLWIIESLQLSRLQPQSSLFLPCGTLPPLALTATRPA